MEYKRVIVICLLSNAQCFLSSETQNQEHCRGNDIYENIGQNNNIEKPQGNENSGKINFAEIEEEESSNEEKESSNKEKKGKSIVLCKL